MLPYEPTVWASAVVVPAKVPIGASRASWTAWPMISSIRIAGTPAESSRSMAFSASCVDVYAR